MTFLFRNFSEQIKNVDPEICETSQDYTVELQFSVPVRLLNTFVKIRLHKNRANKNKQIVK